MPPPTPTPTPPDEDTQGESRKAEQLATAVGAAVLNTLGRPDGLFRVSVVRLWRNRYRVNVHTGPDAVSTRISDSFFVAVDKAGAVVESNPALPRRY